MLRYLFKPFLFYFLLTLSINYTQKKFDRINYITKVKACRGNFQEISLLKNVKGRKKKTSGARHTKDDKHNFTFFIARQP